ncbi:hypothetical protein [Halioxenophilus sp. WMMB6]|uniref:hypothetical protein n=1 Tax=Halioxenophilus sp. WMMB6 TaxID=3073815 RepID=UPI00295F3EF3|nr:hypothetical protein [Halioxenophilus sp. WMMB6]
MKSLVVYLLWLLATGPVDPAGHYLAAVVNQLPHQITASEWLPGQPLTGDLAPRQQYDSVRGLESVAASVSEQAESGAAEPTGRVVTSLFPGIEVMM